MAFIPIISTISSIIGKVIEDKAVAAQATASLQQLYASGAIQEELTQLQAVTTAQTDINKVEAANPSFFVAGARPGAMWVCVLGLFSQLILGPFFTWATQLAGHPTPFPVLNGDMLMTLTFALLGLGAYRSFDKSKGVATVVLGGTATTGMGK